jgi:hypothetical protein
MGGVRGIGEGYAIPLERANTDHAQGKAKQKQGHDVLAHGFVRKSTLCFLSPSDASFIKALTCHNRLLCSCAQPNSGIPGTQHTEQRV